MSSNIHIKNIYNKEAQTELSIAIANFFNEKELLYLCDSALNCTISSSRNVAEKEIIVYQFSRYNIKNSIIVKDILSIDKFPAARYIEIALRYPDNETYNRFTYLYQPDIYSILNVIIANAYNYKVYCNDTLTSYKVIKKNLFKNFANKVFKLFNQIENFRNTTEFKVLENCILKYKFEKRFRNIFIDIFNFNDIIQIEVVGITKEIIRISVNNNETRQIVFLSRDVSGIGELKLIFELIKNHEKVYP